MKSRRAAVMTLGFALLVSAAAQQQGPATPFKSKAELVLVPAYVTRDRQPVRGLKASDFVLLHEGKPEKIAVFDEVEEATGASEPAPTAPQSVRNYRVIETRQGATILLLDFLDMTPLGWGRVHKKLADVARVFVEARTPVVVLALSWNGLVEIMPLSADPAELVEAAERWKTMNNRQVPSGASHVKRGVGSNGLAQMLQIYGVTPDHAPTDVIDKETQDFNKYTMTLAAIEEIAQAYGGLPGRKKLIWISSNIPSYIRLADGKRRWDDRPIQQHMRALKALTDANIAVYPVVANQLVAVGGFDSCGGAISPDYYFIYETGGSVCDDAPEDCVKRAVADAKHYYILGFYLHGVNKPGWHKLKVKVEAMGIDVRSKQAFIAGIQTGLNGILASEAEFVEAALKSPLDYTALPLTLRWSAKGIDDKKRQVELVVSSPAGAVVADGDPPRLDVKFVAYVTPESGGEGQSYDGAQAGELSADQAKQLATAGFIYRKRIELPPGRYDVRVLLRDNITNRTGTVRTNLDLRAGDNAATLNP